MLLLYLFLSSVTFLPPSLPLSLSFFLSLSSCFFWKTLTNADTLWNGNNHTAQGHLGRAPLKRWHRKGGTKGREIPYSKLRQWGSAHRAKDWAYVRLQNGHEAQPQTQQTQSQEDVLPWWWHKYLLTSTTTCLVNTHVPWRPACYRYFLPIVGPSGATTAH